MDLIPPATRETYTVILSASETDEKSLQTAVKELKLWLENQPHLPHEFGEFYTIITHYQSADTIARVHKFPAL